MNTITGKNGYEIPYIEKIKGDENKIAIMVHGFSGSKNGPTANLLFDNFPQNGIGVVTFDFPQHGESPVGGKELRVDNCIKDLLAVEEYVKEHYPDKEILYFGSSYGAYITMLYLTRYPHSGAKAFFRSAAVNMPERFQDFPENELKQFREQGWAIIDHDYNHPLRIYQEFVDDLQSNNLFEEFDPDNGTDIFMIHSDTDEVIEFEKAKLFSEKFDIPMIVVHGADHSLTPQYAKDILMRTCINFYNK